MTQTEIEAKLEILNEQFLQLQRQQEIVRKRWISLGLFSLAFAVTFAVVVIVFSILSLLHGTPNPSTPFGLTMIPLFLLSYALLVATPPSSMR
jgi:hypothetical protein